MRQHLSSDAARPISVEKNPETVMNLETIYLRAFLAQAKDRFQLKILASRTSDLNGGSFVGLARTREQI